MTINWTGLGYLSFMTPLALSAAAILLTGSREASVFRAALLLAAAVVWVVGAMLNRPSRQAGEPAPHQAFGFPMQWSAVGIVGLVVLTLV